MKIIWTKHALERQLEWQIILGITIHDIEQIIKNPDQVVPGDEDDLIAQSKFKNGLIRVPFLEINGSRKILTLYYTSKLNKYWRNT